MPVTLLTPDQAASRLQVARKTVLALLRARRMVGVKVGLQWRIEPAALERFITEQRQLPAATSTSRPVVDPSPVLGMPPTSLARQLMPKTRRFA